MVLRCEVEQRLLHSSNQPSQLSLDPASAGVDLLSAASDLTELRCHPLGVLDLPTFTPRLSNETVNNQSRGEDHQTQEHRKGDSLMATQGTPHPL